MRPSHWELDARKREATITAMRKWDSDGMRLEAASWMPGVTAPSDEDPAWQVVLEVTPGGVREHAVAVPEGAMTAVRVRQYDPSKKIFFTSAYADIGSDSGRTLWLEVNAVGLWMWVNDRCTAGRVRRNATDLAPIAGLSALTSLNLSSCAQLTDLAPIAGLSALTSLNLR